MSKVDEAIEILVSLGLPRQQQNERSALTLLALANLGPKASWKDVRQPLLRIWDIMKFMLSKYNKDYAANSRETIRRQTIHQFEQARIVDRNPDDPTRPTNSGKTVYRLTNDVAAVLGVYRTRSFNKKVVAFIRKFGTLQAAYVSARVKHSVSLKIPEGSTIYLSPGKHNRLQVAVIEEFGPRFASGSSILYLGDTALKHVVCETEQLAHLNVVITQHDKLPDIILYQKERNWLYLIEAVTSHGPLSPKRHREIEFMLQQCQAERIYVTVFPDINTFRKYAADIAWETEVWIAETPDHMIHFNGPKFLGPYGPPKIDNT